mmetsp:Transcript_84580/g.235589  ORF Transcript_84580/g.235589 Transcript_84580/m.235589 type:complete len:265 (-) Transcript_84580:285-1079(-)
MGRGGATRRARKTPTAAAVGASLFPPACQGHNGNTTEGGAAESANTASHAKQRRLQADRSEAPRVALGSARRPHSWHCRAASFGRKSGTQGMSAKLPRLSVNCSTRRWKGQHARASVASRSPGSTHSCMICTRASSTPRPEVGTHGLLRLGASAACSAPLLPETSLPLSEAHPELPEAGGCSWALRRWARGNRMHSEIGEESLNSRMPTMQPFRRCAGTATQKSSAWMMLPKLSRNFTCKARGSARSELEASAISAIVASSKRC